MTKPGSTLEGWDRILAYFKLDIFQGAVQEKLLEFGTRKLLIAEPDAYANAGLTGRLKDHFLYFQELDQGTCVDQVANMADDQFYNEILGQVDGYDVLFLGKDVEHHRERLARELKEREIEVKIVTYSMLEGLCNEVDPEGQKLQEAIGTRNRRAEEELSDRLAEIRGGNDRSIMDQLNWTPLFNDSFDLAEPPTSYLASGKPLIESNGVGKVFSTMNQINTFLGDNPGYDGGIILATQEPELQNVHRLKRYLRGILIGTEVGETSHDRMTIADLGVPCIQNVKMDITVEGIAFGETKVDVGAPLSLDDKGDIYLGEYKTNPSPIMQSAISRAEGKEPKKEGIVKTYHDFMGEVYRINRTGNGMDLYIFANTANDLRLAEALSGSNGKQHIAGVGVIKTENYFSDDDTRMLLLRMLHGVDEDTRRKAQHEIYHIHHDNLRDIVEAAGTRPVQFRLFDSLMEIFSDFHNWYTACEECGYEGSQLKQSMIVTKMQTYYRDSDPNAYRTPTLFEMYPDIHTTQMDAVLDVCAEYVPRGADIRVISSFVRDEKDIKMIMAFMEQRRAVKDIDPQYLPKIGTMIETPSALDHIEDIYMAGASIFIFGTNDLSQLYLGGSRQNARPFQMHKSARHIGGTPPYILNESIKERISGVMPVLKGMSRDDINNKIEIMMSGRHAAYEQGIAWWNNIGGGSIVVPAREVPGAMLNLARAAHYVPRP